MKKSFANIIFKEDYEALDDQEQFEIENNILVPAEEEYLTEATYYDKKEGKEKPKTFKYIHKGYRLNSEIENQIYLCYLHENKRHFGHEIEINRIKLKLHNALNQEYKKEILTNEYQHFTNQLNKIELVKDYFEVYENLDFQSSDFVNYVKGFFVDNIADIIISDDEMIEDIIINSDIPIYVDFILEGHNMNFHKYWIFKELDKINECSKVLNFIKDFDAIESNASKDKGLGFPKTKYYSKVWKSKKTEDLFHKVLKDLNAIDNNGNVEKGKFQPVCDAFYKILNRHKKEVFKFKFSRKDYHLFLNEKYNAGIKDMSRISDGSKYIDEVNRMVENILEEIKSN